MARGKRLAKFVFGLIAAIAVSQLFVSEEFESCPKSQRRAKKYDFPPEEEQEHRPSSSGLLFVGVMTAAQYLDTRAKAVYESWGRDLPGTLVFFSSENSYNEDVPLVALEGVDDRYPPQKKSFMMLKHMHDHYIDKFEWFMRADDDVYVKTDKLERLLRSVDSRKPWFIGQTGRGNTEEFGLLSLETDENFCMGGPGVIFSRETLKRMAPFVDECLANLYTNHEDVELGRCVRRFAGISCTWSYEMQVILYHNQSGQAAFTGDLKQKEVHRAITLHPIKQPQYMYRLHKYVKGLRIQDYQQESIKLHRDIAKSMAELGFRRSALDHANLAENLSLFPQTRGSDGYLGDPNVLGAPGSLLRHKPSNLEEVLDWEIISRTLYSYKDLNPRRRIGSSMKEGLNDVIRDVMELINSYSKQRGRIIDFKDILYGYWRLDPIHGVDLILDLLLVYRKYRGHKMTVQVRRHAYVQQTFVGISVREVNDHQSAHPIAISESSTTTDAANYKVPVHKQIVKTLISTFEANLQPIFSAKPTTKPITIHMILPLSGRHEIFKRFMKMYENLCLSDEGGEESLALYVVLYKNDENPNDFLKSKTLLENLQNTRRNSAIHVVYVEEAFTRARALEYGSRLLKDDDLMLFIDVDIILDAKSLHRIRANTQIGTSVYFPIVYSLYNPKLLNKTLPYDSYEYFGQGIVDGDNGFWRQFGFGIASLYKIDYGTLGGFNLSITGWGLEDVHFYDNAVKSQLKIVRSADPGLIHVYHPVNCDINLEAAQRNMCLGSLVSTVGSLHQLQQFYQRYRHLFR